MATLLYGLYLHVQDYQLWHAIDTRSYTQDEAMTLKALSTARQWVQSIVLGLTALAASWYALRWLLGLRKAGITGLPPAIVRGWARRVALIGALVGGIGCLILVCVRYTEYDQAITLAQKMDTSRILITIYTLAVAATTAIFVAVLPSKISPDPRALPGPGSHGPPD